MMITECTNSAIIIKVGSKHDSLAQFGSDLDAVTKMRLAQGERIVEILKQDKNAPVSMVHQAAIIYAAVNGFLDSVEVKDLKTYEKELYTYLDSHYDGLMKRITDTGLLPDEDENELKAALTEFNSKFRA